MKKLSMFLALGLMVAGLGVFTSCEGPAGVAGKDGIAGVDGVDGEDANATCTQCHNSGSVLIAKSVQYAHSQHATGSTAFENATGCAICHTSEGYLERLGTHKYATAAVINDPTPIGCRTCHKIHATYEAADWDLTATEAVVMFADSTSTLDMGAGNACITCHQSRTISPNFVTGVKNDSMTITSSRWGTHHGPQAELVAGILGQTFGNTADNSNHKNAPDGCVTCHMGSALGVVAGGHTFKVVDEEEGLVTSGCLTAGCHSTAPKLADVETFQAGIQADLTALEAKFVANGWMDGTTLLWKATSSKPLKLKKAEASAMFNYKMVWEDKSLGVHNPKYVKFLLAGAKTAMGI